jgi:hypothetical protein
MAEIKLLRLEYGDSQKNITDKLNYNFSRLILFGDGPYGKRGKIGPDGPKGPKGPTGSFGDMGDRGSNWSVGPSAPSPDVSIDGDFWMNTSNGNELYYFQSGNWIDYGFAVNTSDLFSVFGPVSTSSGVSTRSGYFISSGTPINYTFVLSDAIITDGTDENNPNLVTNPQYSKMVISIDGADAGKNIMEFSKSEYANNPLFFAKTPRFYWYQSLMGGPYGLCFGSGDSISFNLNQSSLSLSSGVGYDFLFNSLGFNASVNTSQGFASAGNGNFSLNLNGGNILFSTSNISYSNSQFFFSGALSVSTNANDTAAPLQLASNSPTTGNLRYVYPSGPDSNAVLFTANQISPSYINLFSVAGDGLVYYNKKINSIQTTQTITQTVSSTTSLGVSVNWTTVVPSIAMDGTPGSYYFASNGTEYNIEKSTLATAGDRGICLWTPATGGGIDNNGGWLNLLNDGECINFRVNCTSGNFRYIGLNTSNSPNNPPSNGTIPNYSYYDLGSLSAARSIDFTILNVTNAGNTNSSRRWYIVYFSAWPDNPAGDVICGSLSTYGSTYTGSPAPSCQNPSLFSVTRNANNSLTYNWNNNAVDIGAGTIILAYSLDGGATWVSTGAVASPNSTSATSSPLPITIGTPIRYRLESHYSVAGPISCNTISNVIITTF